MKQASVIAEYTQEYPDFEVSIKVSVPNKQLKSMVVIWPMKQTSIHLSGETLQGALKAFQEIQELEERGIVEL